EKSKWTAHHGGPPSTSILCPFQSRSRNNSCQVGVYAPGDRRPCREGRLMSRERTRIAAFAEVFAKMAEEVCGSWNFDEPFQRRKTQAKGGFVLVSKSTSNDPSAR